MLLYWLFVCSFTVFLIVAIRLLRLLQTIFESLERQSEQPGKYLGYYRNTDTYEGFSSQLFWSWQFDFCDFCRRFLKVSSDSQNSLGSISDTTEIRTLMKASLAGFSDRGISQNKIYCKNIKVTMLTIKLCLNYTSNKYQVNVVVYPSFLTDTNF